MNNHLKALFIFVLLIINVAGHCQKSETFQKHEKTYGKNLITKKEIRGPEYEFSSPIEKFQIDTTTNFITIQLRHLSKITGWPVPTGKIIFFDAAKKEIRWDMKFNYQFDTLVHIGDLILKTNFNLCYRLKPEDGSQQWKTIYFSLCFIEPRTSIALGYGVMGAKTNILKGLDLASGQELWTRPLNRENGWNEALMLNDSVVMINSSGVHTVRLKDGTGWDISLKTGEKAKGGVRSPMILNLGALNNTLSPNRKPNFVNSLVSNILKVNDQFFIASQDKLVCFNESGNEIWNAPLPPELTSRSVLFMRHGILYLLNRGFAFISNTQIEYGKPYLAAFEPETGNQKFLNIISAGFSISDYLIYNETLSLISGSSVLQYSLADGHRAEVETFNEDQYSRLYAFPEDFQVSHETVYAKSGETEFHELINDDSSKLIVITLKPAALILNEKLKVAGQIEASNLFLSSAQRGKFRILTNMGDDSKAFIVNGENKVIAEIKSSVHSGFSGKKFYFIRDKSLIEIDLSEVIGN